MERCAHKESPSQEYTLYGTNLFKSGITPFASKTRKAFRKVPLLLTMESANKGLQPLLDVVDILRQYISSEKNNKLTLIDEVEQVSKDRVSRDIYICFG